MGKRKQIIYKGIFQDLDDVIQLKSGSTKREAGAARSRRIYSFADMKELQSKLTLVATTKQNKNMGTIDTFDKVLPTSVPEIYNCDDHIYLGVKSVGYRLLEIACFWAGELP